MKLILGSKSYGRKHVLQRAGYEFEVMSADIDEKAIRSDDFEELPLFLARAKAEALVKQIEEPAILITSDQVVVFDGQLREKPETEIQARKYLTSYSGKWLQANTAVVVTNTETGKQAEALDIAKAYINSIPQAVIDQLIHEGKVMYAAGGIIVEHPLIAPYITEIQGSLDSITGLPVLLTKKLIAEVTS